MGQVEMPTVLGHAKGVLVWSSPGWSLLGPPGTSCLVPHHTCAPSKEEQQPPKAGLTTH